MARTQGTKVVREQGPKLVDRLQRTGAAQRVMEAIGSSPQQGPGIDVRPAASTSFPTAQRARQVVYAPDLDGKADPGEIVWSWVTFEEDPSKGKDRPVLVVGRNRTTLLGLMLSSNPERAHDRDWIGVGKGQWDHEGRSSWVRLDRVLDVPEAGIRREGAILDRAVFDLVAERLVNDFGWGR